MVRKVSKLPKWAIKKFGISKRAWAAARRGRGKTAGRSTPRASSHNPGRAPGIISKINKFTRGIKLALPAIGSFTTRSGMDAVNDVVTRYSGFNLEEKKLETDKVKKAAAFYGGNIIEHKVMSLARIPQMAGRKKILALVAQYLPEIGAIPSAMQGDFVGAGAKYGEASIGYDFRTHTTWLENAGLRTSWLGTLGSRVALGLMSRFLGPMINKHLPKGVNL